MAADGRWLGPGWGAGRAWVALALLLAAALALAAERIEWPREFYNPQPKADDVLLPLPCGGAMAFRWVQAEGRVPAGADPTAAALYRLIGPFLREGRHELLVGKYEVSRLQWETLAAMSGGPCPQASEAGRLVQGGIGWADAMGFAARWSRWLAENAQALPDCASAATLCVPREAGRLALLRLPTEAVWEYAARGGLAVSPVQFGQPLYPMEGGLERHVWFERNSDQKLKPIGQRAANPLGLHDLYGNVEELTSGLYGSAPFPGQAGAAVIRGGSVHTSRDRIDAGQRGEALFYGHGGANRAPDNGFRLIADLAPAGGAVLAQSDPLPTPGGAGVVAPAPAVAVASATGQIQVNVDTPAEVRIDGKLVGQAAPGAPLEVQGLAVGEHRVDVSAEGHQSVSERHDVTAGRWTQVAVAMQPSSTSGTLTETLTGAWQALTAAVASVPPMISLSLLYAVVAFIAVRALTARYRSGPMHRPALATEVHSPTPIALRHPFEPEMIDLPGGVFWMGSPDGEANRWTDEGPRHKVRVAPFAIGKTAITFAQYDAFAQATGRAKPSDLGWGRDQRPVINVSWDDAVAYAAWLSKETGQKYRLPSEAEWEYAARAGTETPFWTGKCIHTDQANYDGNYDYNSGGAKTGVYRKQTVPVGSLPANPWGLHEVHGNVREWVQDPWHDSYAGAPTDGSVWGLGGSSARVVRGGSWNNSQRELRAAKRLKYEPFNRLYFLGFRLAKTLPEVSDPLSGHIATATVRIPSASAMTPGSISEVTAATVEWAVPDRPAVSARTIRAPTLLVPRQAFEPQVIALPGGEFWMGSPDNEPERFAVEGPRHRVRIAPFAIGKYAATFAQYDAFAQATGRSKPGDEGWGRGDRPVINVSWEDAVAYAGWLSQETGEKYRLPSEAEWEYAARAGTETPFWTGTCIKADQANYDGTYDYNGCGARTWVSRRQTVPVGSLPANPWGLHEVHGNVREWVQDPWHRSYADGPTDGSAWEAGGGSARVVRGGSWDLEPRLARAAYRLGFGPGIRDNNLGFRLARTLSS